MMLKHRLLHKNRDIQSLCPAHYKNGMRPKQLQGWRNRKNASKSFINISVTSQPPNFEAQFSAAATTPLGDVGKISLWALAPLTQNL